MHCVKNLLITIFLYSSFIDFNSFDKSKDATLPIIIQNIKPCKLYKHNGLAPIIAITKKHIIDNSNDKYLILSIHLINVVDNNKI